MWLQWMPWRWIIKNVARRKGFLDPIVLMSQLERFAQPSEVAAPTELLRSGAVLHARGLINSQAIQHNLDWVWPYWVERQFSPKDISFVPRAFSVTHINLTHRNWTAVGLPDEKYLPIVDPRGLVTPFYDGWSVDAWIITKENKNLIPSQLMEASQRITQQGNIEIITGCDSDGLTLSSRASMEGDLTLPQCEIEFTAQSRWPGYLVISLRPYNPEGISFIHDISVMKDMPGFKVNKNQYLYFDAKPSRYVMSDYRKGDVFSQLKTLPALDDIKCDVGMATAAAVFELNADDEKTVTARVPLRPGKDISPPFKEPAKAASLWDEQMSKAAELNIPDEKFKFLYNTAVRTLILHSPEEVYPGPYTYKRFWFRDAAFILYGLLVVGYKDRVKRSIDKFLSRQTPVGYFLSQEGEWDSNGEALWIMDKFCEMTNSVPQKNWLNAVDKGARWICRKRLSSKGDSIYAGLLPSGFSAEHLGPNDYYYWDDFWGIAGLEAAYNFTARHGNKDRAKYFKEEADDFKECIQRSLQQVSLRLGKKIIPASPSRRMDAGAIGSICGSYPLQVFPAGDERVKKTLEYLLDNCLFAGGFFQDMTHSGINQYLTLHMAQVLLRDFGGDRHIGLMRAVAELASPTGQWPEAIHPHTKGGCMGDGQHVWAAAEWIIMIRNCFVREESSRMLVLANGVPWDWLKTGEEISFGKTQTIFGEISVKLQYKNNLVYINWQGSWHVEAPAIEVHLPGFKKVKVNAGQHELILKEEDRL